MNTFEEIYIKSLKESINNYNLEDYEIDEILIDFIELILNQNATL